MTPPRLAEYIWMCLHDDHLIGIIIHQNTLKMAQKTCAAYDVHSQYIMSKEQKLLPVVFPILISVCRSLKKICAKCDGQVGVKCMGVLFVLFYSLFLCLCF